ncbi:MAG TPA: hypothetical protein VMZ53_09830 [Kofleriaceae bacterium]|nr:hypothetical protein [Kofleriaceae bacterium]
MHVRTFAAMLVMIAACDAADDGVMPDAPSIDAPLPDSDPFVCMTTARTAGPACLALTPSHLGGVTPFGNLDVDLAYVGAGDCISHSRATIQWIGACQEELVLQFPYPTMSDSTAKRFVTGSFDPTWATVELRAYGEPPRRRDSSVHVDVTDWREGDGVHSIDITVTFTDPGFAIAPMHIAGTFCDWPYYLC